MLWYSDALMAHIHKHCPDCNHIDYQCVCVPTKWCENCIYFQESRHTQSQCVHPKLTELDLTTGGRVPRPAHFMRQNLVSVKTCGSAARYYTPHAPARETLVDLPETPWTPTSLEIILSLLLIGAALYVLPF